MWHEEKKRMCISTNLSLDWASCVKHNGWKRKVSPKRHANRCQYGEDSIYPESCPSWGSSAPLLDPPLLPVLLGHDPWTLQGCVGAFLLQARGSTSDTITEAQLTSINSLKSSSLVVFHLSTCFILNWFYDSWFKLRRDRVMLTHLNPNPSTPVGLHGGTEVPERNTALWDPGTWTISWVLEGLQRFLPFHRIMEP